MQRLMVSAVAGLLGSLSAAAVSAEPVSHERLANGYSSYMRVYGVAQPPYGFVRYCETNPRDCAQVTGDDRRPRATPERLSDLDEVNRTVNLAVQPLTDQEIYGVNELWVLPRDKGDCEDYALLKRQILMERGWPGSSLLLTVVRDERGEGHAVLTARTAQGDYVLDNKADEVKLWYQTPYQFVMRQSYLNPRVWVSLDVLDGASPAALAGVENRR